LKTTNNASQTCELTNLCLTLFIIKIVQYFTKINSRFDIKDKCMRWYRVNDQINHIGWKKNE